MNDILLTSHRDGVATWTLNRIEALNAVNDAVMTVLVAALTQLEADRAIKVLVLTARGDTFISGGDLRAFADLKTAEQGRGMANRMKSILERIEQLPCITICLVNGDAYGGGCETALAFDQIWLHESAKMGFTQANFALTPGWGGYTRLIERVGANTALQWLSERARVDASTAFARGLIERVIPESAYHETVDEHLRAIAHTDTAVLGALKTLRRAVRSESRLKWMALEGELFEQLWASDEHHARVERFLDRSRS